MKCDKCGCYCKDDCGNENFESDFEAIDCASDNMWEFVKNKDSESFSHYCPECVKATEEEFNEPITIKYLVERSRRYGSDIFHVNETIVLTGDRFVIPSVTRFCNSVTITYDMQFFEENKSFFKRLEP